MPDVRPQDRLAMIAELADAAGLGGTCGGQALDLAAEGKTSVFMRWNKYNHKTGALIRASVRMGAMSAGEAGYAVLPALDTYAQAIGPAFQVQDDILDVIGHTDVIEKAEGSDAAAHGKSTYPSLLGLKAAQDKAQALYQESLAALSQLEEHHYNTATLRELANFVIERNS